MTAFSKRRRNRTAIAAVCGVIVLIAAPLLGYLGWNVLQDSKAGTEAKALEEVAFPSTPAAMFAVVNDQQEITSVAIMVLAPYTGKGGTLISVPVSASTAQSSEAAEIPLADSLINSGEEGLVSDVESLMRVTLDQHAILDAEGLEKLLTPVGTITATLPNDVETATDAGSTQTVFVAGDTQLTPADATKVLLARDPSQPESKRLPNVRAVWNGVAQGIGQGINPTAVTATAPTDFNDFVNHFFAGPVQVFGGLETTPLTGKSNPNNLDVGRLDVSTVVLVMAQLAPSAVIAPQPTLNFRIENGVTQQDIDAAGLKDITPVDVTRDLVARLLFLSGNVISVSPEIYTPTDKTVPDNTLVYATNGVESGELDTFTTALGKVDFVEPTFQFPLVNVVIVVGKSYLADMAEKAAQKAATETGDTSGTGAPSSDAGAGSSTDGSATTVTS